MNKSSLLTFGAIIITLLAIAGMVQYARSNNGTLDPKFVFDSSQAADWWSSGNSNQQLVAGSNYKGEEPREKLPVADMSVHHIKADRSAADDGCFVLFSYYNYQLESISEAYEQYEAKKVELGKTADLKTLDSTEQKVASDQGDISFELKRYDLAVPGNDILSGYAVGFANTETGHLRVENVCKTAVDLTSAELIIAAVKLSNL